VRTKPYLCSDTQQLEKVAALNGLSPCEFEALLPRRCRHFISCSRRDCPLDPLQILRDPPWPGEQEERCHAQRPARQRIIEEARAKGLLFDLHYDGLTKEEWDRQRRSRQAKERFKALSQKDQGAKLQGLKRGREERGRYGPTQAERVQTRLDFEGHNAQNACRKTPKMSRLKRRLS
jgi:hypothetical protein